MLIVIMIAIMIAIAIPVPVVLGFPALISPVPPLVILIPTTLPFSIQVPPSFLGLVAVLAILLDRPVQSCFRLADGVLTFVSFISLRSRCRDQQEKRARHNRCC